MCTVLSVVVCTVLIRFSRLDVPHVEVFRLTPSFKLLLHFPKKKYR
jgi:hypothetical protein